MFLLAEIVEIKEIGGDQGLYLCPSIKLGLTRLSLDNIEQQADLVAATLVVVVVTGITPREAVGQTPLHAVQGAFWVFSFVFLRNCLFF